jgi:hypothetical protein
MTEERKLLSLAERKELVARMPWILRRKVAVPCDGIKWGAVALRDLYNWGPKDKNPPRGIQDRARCKLQAEWHISMLDWHITPAGFARAADFCWHHLIAFMYEPGEDDRVNKWLRNNGYPDAGMPIDAPYSEVELSVLRLLHDEEENNA